MSATTTGTYIPEGGVWTARNRAGWNAINPYSTHQATVDALIRALEACHAELTDHDPCAPGCEYVALLAAVKS